MSWIPFLVAAFLLGAGCGVLGMAVYAGRRIEKVEAWHASRRHALPVVQRRALDQVRLECLVLKRQMLADDTVILPLQDVG